MLAIRLSKEIESRLEYLAKNTGKTKTFYAKQAILTYLEDLEDAYEAEVAYLEYKNSGEKGITLEEMEHRFDFANQV